MGSTGKKVAILLGVAAGAALATFAITKKGKRARQDISRKVSDLKDGMISSVKGKVKHIESENSFI